MAAVAAGADMLGFILFPKSPRYVTPAQVAAIVAALRRSGQTLPLVGVFVNAAPAAVRAILDETGLDLAQLHGDEDVAAFTALAGRIYKALRPQGVEDALAAAAAWTPLAGGQGPQLLVDAYDPRAYGGTGQKADWGVAAEIARRYPRMLLAGGLAPANVAAAVRSVQPWGVDVASGVERTPGSKEPEKVRAFVAAAKTA